MNKHTVIAYCVGFFATTFTFWLGGFDFDHRGDSAVWWFICANMSGLVSTISMLAIKDLS